ncbi:acetyltransferase [Helicobacter sp. MIT 05-5294]|uniref:acetyltransferase n=1 Tax=Helicobacter sp. MIT 05-5294 TaxID=1548150 RepID=UPI00051FA8F4|nr:acetyltransferase [Helicobacter sp. MIT 05-5294]TLD89214.1 acetyltransferase [Helicobacter sp. MIT 05-5294]
MEKLAIFGAGGHGAVVADILESQNLNFKILIDDNPKGKTLNKIGAISREEFLKLADAREFSIILAIGDDYVRQKLYEFFAQNGFRLPFVAHKSAIISKSAKISDGAVIMPNAVINARAQIGIGAIINSGSVIEHDCKIGDFSHIAPNATLCGGVCVGICTHIGASSVVIEGKQIGDYCVIGAGSVVIGEIQSRQKVVGNPAKKILN